MPIRPAKQQWPTKPRQKALPAKPVSPRQRALALLARREHSAVELAAKLAGRGLPEQQATQLVAQLASEGLQSDLRFAESFTRSRAEKWGRPRILRALADKGLDPETAAAGMAAVLDANASESQDESERALAVLQKRFAAAAASPRERQRQWRFLQARGFAANAAAKALNAFAGQEKN